MRHLPALIIGILLALFIIASVLFAGRISKSFYNNQLMVGFLHKVNKCYEFEDLPSKLEDMEERFRSNVQRGNLPTEIMDDFLWVKDHFVIVIEPEERNGIKGRATYFVEKGGGEKFYYSFKAETTQ